MSSRIYEHRRSPSETIVIGLFQRCENQLISVVPDTNKIYPICDANKYLPTKRNLTGVLSRLQPQEAQRLCNIAGNPHRCSYSTVNRVLISSTIIAACAIGLSMLGIYSHLLLNQFKYKTHVGIAALTVALLLTAFVFLLITLILLGSTMSNELFEYRYNLNYRLAERSKPLARVCGRTSGMRGFDCFCRTTKREHWTGTDRSTDSSQ